MLNFFVTSLKFILPDFFTWENFYLSLNLECRLHIDRVLIHETPLFNVYANQINIKHI